MGEVNFETSAAPLPCCRLRRSRARLRGEARSAGRGIPCRPRCVRSESPDAACSARSETQRSPARALCRVLAALLQASWRSEEHTSELQSLTNLVCRLLLEKKKQSCSVIRLDSFC